MSMSTLDMQILEIVVDNWRDWVSQLRTSAQPTSKNFLLQWFRNTYPEKEIVQSINKLKRKKLIAGYSRGFYKPTIDGITIINDRW